MARGGPRPGSGRPKGAVSTATRLQMEMKEALVKYVHENFTPFLEAQGDLALGSLLADHPVFDENTGKMVKAKIYKDKPDGSSLRYLMDQTVGKAKETIEHTGEVRGIIQIVRELEEA